MAGKSKVNGITEVINSLQSVGAEIENDRLQERIRATSQIIIDTAKSKVPVDTGDLRDSIGFIKSKDSAHKSKVLIGLQKSYYNHYLGVMFEFGTEPRMVKSGAYRGIITPRPFMRPAVDQNREKVINGVKNSLLTTIAEVAKKYGFKFATS